MLIAATLGQTPSRKRRSAWKVHRYPAFSSAKPGASLPQGWGPSSLPPASAPLNTAWSTIRGKRCCKPAKARRARSLPVKFDIRGADARMALEGRQPDRRRRQQRRIEGRLARAGGARLRRGPVQVHRSRARRRRCRRATTPVATCPFHSSSTSGRTTRPSAPSSPTRARSGTNGGILRRRRCGKWQTLSRNVLEDFRRAFGEEPGMPPTSACSPTPTIP